MLKSLDLIEDGRLYSPEEYSEFTGETPKTAGNNRALGLGCPYVKIGGRVRYQGRDIRAHVQSCRIIPAERRVRLNAGRNGGQPSAPQAA